MRQADERTCQGQRDVGRRIGERLTDLSFWRSELNTELERLLHEFGLLTDTRRKANKALQVQNVLIRIYKSDKSYSIPSGLWATATYYPRMFVPSWRTSGHWQGTRSGGEKSFQRSGPLEKLQGSATHVPRSNRQTIGRPTSRPAFVARGHRLQRINIGHRHRLSQADQSQSRHQLLWWNWKIRSDYK